METNFKIIDSATSEINDIKFIKVEALEKGSFTNCAYVSDETELNEFS